MATRESAAARYVTAMDRRLQPEAVAPRLRRLPGWIALPTGVAITCNYRFAHAAGPLLFANFFAAFVRASPFDLAFVLDLAPCDVGVGLGAGSFDGITPACFALAREADRLARRNHGRA